MDVRQARPTDAPLVLALALDEDSYMVRGTDWLEDNSAVRTILHVMLPVARTGRVWLARDTSCTALLEARPRRYVIGWDIRRLVVHGSNDEVFAEIVQVALDYLQRCGIPRLFGRCGDQGLEALRHLDFRPLVREFVLSGPGPRTPQMSGLPPGSRYRMPQDAWPLHQLANAVTPALVRQLEGATSMEWLERRGKSTEIVVERDGQIVAWIGWYARPRGRYTPVGMMVHPDHADLAPDLLSHVLDQASGSRQLVARVREYQERTLQAFLDAGFRITSEETVVVRHGLLIPAPIRQRVRTVTIPTISVSPMVGVGPGANPALYIRHPEKEGPT